MIVSANSLDKVCAIIYVKSMYYYSCGDLIGGNIYNSTLCVLWQLEVRLKTSLYLISALAGVYA